MSHSCKKYLFFLNNGNTIVTLKLFVLITIVSIIFFWMRPQGSVLNRNMLTVMPVNLTVMSSMEEKTQEPWLPSGENGNNTKKVLIWTTHFFKSGVDAFCVGEKGSRRQKEICDYDCEFTTDRNAIDSSHAVVFNERDLTTDRTRKHLIAMPKTRLKSQYWIFLNLETPSHSFTNLSTFENIFNWTMTYRSDSDVFYPYGLVKEHPHRQINNTNYVLENIQKKTKLVAWIVSNSVLQQSKRKELVAELKKYIQIDIYGKYEKLKCSNGKSNFCTDLLSCYTQIGMAYKFYFAFENSLCEDYVTEKAFNALRTGMVPVVYGYANYTKFLPPNSFINVRDFPSAKELANYLIHLNENAQEYLNYFEWTKGHVILEDTLYMERAWCSLCERLHLDSTSSTSKVIGLKNWWNFRNNSNVCVNPPRDFHSKLV